MEIIIAKDQVEIGRRAGLAAADSTRKAIAENGQANIILATGTSQFETLSHLTSEPEIDWSRVIMFHLDEYIGLPITARASFGKYLKERFLEKVPAVKEAYLIDGEADAREECERLSELIRKHPIDVALVGIGENGHLAFNDPPADFETEQPYIKVTLDERCRKQQVAEGWFNSMNEVPKQAISMSIKQIMKSKHIICSVPGARKAVAVKNCLQQLVNNKFPASILQLHSNCQWHLDEASASLISKKAES